MLARPAMPADAPAIASIYNESIEDRNVTFETEPRSAGDVLGWLEGTLPVVVVEKDEEVIAFAGAGPYSFRHCYRGIADISVYVARSRRGQGAGRMALEALIAKAAQAGLWKLVARIFVENSRSRKLVRSLGFREVGIHEKHGVLDGVWRDCVVVERMIP